LIVRVLNLIVQTPFYEKMEKRCVGKSGHRERVGLGSD